MIKITKAQRELLERAAADAEGAVDAPEDAKLNRPLVKHGLAISLPITGGGSRLMITSAGRALVAADQAGGGEGSDEPAAAGRSGSETKPSSDEPSGATPADETEPRGEGEEPETTAEDTVTGSPTGTAQPEASKEEPPDGAADKRPGRKLGTLVDLLSRPNGATLDEMVTATGWQPHSVRGAMSGGLKKKQGLTITSTKTDGTRVYRIVAGEQS